jgi:1,4-dihydroxy-2-naphthoate octaprenyltransferase
MGKKEKNVLEVWFYQIRGPFLILSIALVLIGITASRQAGFFHVGQSLLLMAGVVLAHISVNLFNEVSDFETGIDEYTVRTPFSGGSGMIQSGLVTPENVRMAAYINLAGAAVIGIYFFFVRSWFVLLPILAGGTAVRYYSTHFARWMLGEMVAGLTLGSLVIVGTYYCLTGTVNDGIVFISIPPGILTAILLLLNEFPDAAADKRGGRHHLVIHFGKARTARIFAAALIAAFGCILIAPLFFDLPKSLWIALFTLPLACRTIYVVLNSYEDLSSLMPALAMNVAVVILTDLLIAAGFLL